MPIYSQVSRKVSKMEIWKDVKDHPGFQVSNTGKVRSLDKYVGAKNGSIRFLPGRILHQRVNTSGYFDTALMKKRIYVHTLVAEAFVEKKDGCNQVNHIDENKLNNIPTNLEWCNQKQNNSHGTRLKRIAHAASIGVISVNLSNGVIHEYESLREAASKLGITPNNLRYHLDKNLVYLNHEWVLNKASRNRSVAVVDANGKLVEAFESIRLASDAKNIKLNAIWRTCQGMTKTAGGFRWRYL
jgi:hypothetical protein